MKIINIFTISNLKLRQLSIVVLSIQLIFLGLIGFDEIGIHIPILRELVGYIYLTFVPGILTLRILRLHKLDNIESLLYSSGISISILMFLGLLINTLYPYFRIQKPLSFAPIIISIYFVTIILLILCYIRDRDYSCENYVEIKDLLNYRIYILCLIPFLSLFGTYLVSIYNNNIVLLLLILIIATIPLLVGFNKLLYEDLYPLAVFVISISLLYHASLISQYLWGTDIHTEYFVSNLVQTSGFWNPNKYGSLYSLLSLNILSPIYSILLDMDTKWVLKIIFPFIFSFLPLGLYKILQEQTNAKIAFFSSFFFMSVTPFYTIMLEVPRQEVAEFFFILYFLLMVSDSINIVNKKILSIIFAFSLVVSHYGLACIYIFSLAFSWLILSIIKRYPNFDVFYLKNISTKKEILTSNFTILVLAFTILWYMTVSESSVFQAIIGIGKNIVITFFSGALDKNDVESLSILTMDTVSPLHSITKYLHLVSQLFISIGIFSVLFLKLDMKFRKEFLAYSITFLFITMFILIAPNSSSVMGITRLYPVLLLSLSQFLPLGCIFAIYTLLRSVNKAKKNFQDISFKCLSVFLSVFILFNSGFMYQIANDHPQSISLDSKLLHPRFVYNDGDMNGLTWLLKYIDKEKSTIYSDECEGPLVHESVDKNKIHLYDSKTDSLPLNSYVFMGPLNNNYNEIIDYSFDPTGYSRKYLKFNNSIFYHKVILCSDEIFDNGITYVYK
jgi:uncharacterized membrane protein